MASQRFVIFDLETLPDLERGRLLLGVDANTSDAQVRVALGQRYARADQEWSEAFIKAPLHRIACIGALYAQRDDKRGALTIARAGVGHIGLRNERELVASFLESLGEMPAPQLIGFNSSSFDLPVLRYRAMAHGLSAAVIHGGNGRDYWYRYGRDHIDLCDFISAFGASARPSLMELAALCGFPGKLQGIDGSRVEQMVAEGFIDDVATYCEADVLTTYFVFLRYLLIIGEVSEQAYFSSVKNALAVLEQRSEKRTLLQPYVEALSRALPRNVPV